MTIKPKQTQIRLLIPEEWAQELKSLSKAHFTSRLALLRKYIREKMKEDFEQLSRDFDTWNRLKPTTTDLQERLKSHARLGSHDPIDPIFKR